MAMLMEMIILVLVQLGQRPELLPEAPYGKDCKHRCDVHGGASDKKPHEPTDPEMQRKASEDTLKAQATVWDERSCLLPD